MHSIRFKLSAITIAAILTTALCVVLASFYTIQTENNRQTAEMMNLIAHDTEQSLEKYTENIEQSVEMIGHIASDTLDSTILVQCGVVGSGKDLGPVGGEGAGNPSQTSEQAEKLDARELDSRMNTYATSKRLQNFCSSWNGMAKDVLSKMSLAQ